ncbi:unnamed protein product [Bathycoccus prasinos]
MGWVPPCGFEASLTKSIKWTLQNRHWLELKRWAEDPYIYEEISPGDIRKVFDPAISTSNTKKAFETFVFRVEPYTPTPNPILEI